MLYKNYMNVITHNILTLSTTTQLKDHTEPELVIYCSSLFNLNSDGGAPTLFSL